jgi:adenylate kinase
VFTKRLDDTPEVLRVRLQEYHEKTKPLIDLYEEKRLLRRVDATRSVEVVFQDIEDQLKLAKPSTFR